MLSSFVHNIPETPAGLISFIADSKYDETNMCMTGYASYYNFSEGATADKALPDGTLFEIVGFPNGSIISEARTVLSVEGDEVITKRSKDVTVVTTKYKFRHFKQLLRHIAGLACDPENKKLLEFWNALRTLIVSMPVESFVSSRVSGDSIQISITYH